MKAIKDRRKNKKRAKKGNRRGGFFSMLIEPYFQVKLGAMILLLNVVFGALICAVVSYYVVDIHDTVSLYFQFTEDEKTESWHKFFLPLVVCMVLVLVFFILTFFIIIRYTHSIYGPLVNIHAYLDQLLEFKKKQETQELSSCDLDGLAPLHIRASDQLKLLADKINTVSKLVLHQKETNKKTESDKQENS